MQLTDIRVLRGESAYCNITINDVSKFSGIQWQLKRFNMKEYIAFGDSLNDYKMFKHATIPIVMGQDNEQLKKLVKYVTTSVDENGIYNACKEVALT